MKESNKVQWMSVLVIGLMVLIVFVAYRILGPGVAEDEWWESIETKERIKISSVGTGRALNGTLMEMQRRDPDKLGFLTLINYDEDDSLKTCISTMRVEWKSSAYSTVLVTHHHIIPVYRLKQDYIKIK